MTTKLLVDLSPEIADRLKQVCDETGGTKGGFIRLAVDLFLQQRDIEESQRFFVTLPQGLAETMAAYRHLYDYPDRDKMIESAMRMYIGAKAQEDPTLPARIEQAKKDRMRRRGDLVAIEEKRSKRGSRTP